MGITAYREYFDFNQTGSDPMKIERINENQIRCTLSNFDLSVRNMNLGELAYGSEKARNLFREMIQRAANEVGFEAEDIPLMVEAIPMANESDADHYEDGRSRGTGYPVLQVLTGRGRE